MTTMFRGPAGSGVIEDVPPADRDSLLELEGPALLGRWSSRQARHRLSPLRRGEFWRDHTGTARFSPLPGRKYAVQISAADIRPPAFAALWPGVTVTATLANPVALPVPAGTDMAVFDRDILPASVMAHGRDGAVHPVLSVQDRTVSLTPHAAMDITLRARMRLTMMVTEWSAEFEEWDGRHPWSLTLEEV